MGPLKTSSNTNFSLCPTGSPSNNSSLYNDTVNPCFTSNLSLLIISTFFLTNLFLLFLFFYICYLSYHQSRRHPATSSSSTGSSNIFMFHSITLQLFTFLGFTCYICGGYVDSIGVSKVGLCLWSTLALGQALFNILTCVEHYLAVVHPIVYVGLRQADEAQIRNISTGCVWVLSLGWFLVDYYISTTLPYIILYCCIMAGTLISTSLCSILILCALKQPGPGEAAGGKRQRVDQSKQRSFHTVTVIMGAMMIKFGGNLMGILITTFERTDPSMDCLVPLLAFWIDLPSTMVLPLLFLLRTGKLQCCKRNVASG